MSPEEFRKLKLELKSVIKLLALVEKILMFLKIMAPIAFQKRDIKQLMSEYSKVLKELENQE